LSKGIYKNIIKFGLHWEATRTPVLPCPDVIEWIIQRVDHEKRAILNFEDKSVASYQASVLNQLYHFKEAHVKVTLEWLKQKNDCADFLSIIKGWWSKGQFRSKPASVEWNTSKFRKSIYIIVIFLIQSVQKERCFKFSRQVDSHNLPSHHKWINIELGRTHFI
jgi:hypothetical protein